MNGKQRKKYCLAAGICLLALQTAVKADITTGLTAYWKFDETSGVTAEDSTGRGNHATLINFQENNTMWVTGRIGGVLQFNLPDGGDDDQVVTDNPIVLDNQDSFTFAFWARRQPGGNPFNPRFITPVSNQHWVLWTPGTGVGIYVPARTADPPVGAWRHPEITGFILENSDVLPATAWSPTPGVANNRVIVQPTGRHFFRLRKQ